MTQEELEKEISNLKRDLELVKQEQDTKKTFQLDYPIDENSKKIISDVINDKILDLVWTKYYYYSTFFESIDGYTQTTGGTGSVDISDTRIAVNTGATNGSSAELQKNPTNQTILRWDRESRFRINFDVSATTNQEIRIAIGDASNGIQDSHYGFWVDDSTLKGTASNGTTSASVTLKTISSSTPYDIEARFYPGKRVDFFVDGKLLGSITDQSKLPSADTTKTFIPFFTFYIENQAGEVKIAECSWFEYIQER